MSGIQQKKELNGRVDKYFPFHLHTEYSALDGFSTVEEYFKRCNELGLDSIGITEHGNLYSAPYIEKERCKEEYRHIKAVYGSELYESFDRFEKNNDNKYFHLVCLAKNENGRLALNKIITESSKEECFYYKPRVDLELLKPYAKDLIVSSACLGSKIARENDYEKCINYINEYKCIFPNFYLEMQSHSSNVQVEYNKKILKLSKDTDTRYVITCDAHASSEEELKYQGYHVKIAKDTDTTSEIYEGCYLQSVEDIYNVMIPQIGESATTIGLQNTLYILDIIEDVKIPFSEPQLPEIKFDNISVDQKLRELVMGGFEYRKIQQRHEHELQDYIDRAEYELNIVSEIGFSSYFVIVWDFVNYARNNGVSVEVRGSAGSSILLYLIGVSNIDPIKYGLIFERFLNKERINLPDVDIDVADQQVIINYLENKYGKDKVCRVMNFSYITPKVAIKDVGDVLGLPYKIRDEVSKLFPSDDFERDYSENIVKISSYIENNPEYQEWFDISREISGKLRQTSMHACAVGILNYPVTQIMPVQVGEDGEKVIQCDMKMVEALGVVKFDILGVKTLKVISDTLKLIKKDDSYIDLDDEVFINNKKAYDIISSGNTDGLFQIESYGMKELFKNIKATNIGEISDGISLYRPDAMGFIQDYLSVKHKMKDVEYIHSDIEPILSKTYGALIYQEQVLSIIRKFANRTYGQADIVRRAIGKKNKKLVLIESEKLRDEIIANKYDKHVSDFIANYLAEAGNYSFNLSHGVGYATMTYRTAFLKANHTLEYMTSLLNSEIGNFEAISKYIVNCKQMEVEVLPPSINKSSEMFSIYNGKILFGISMIKGVGNSTSMAIIEERNNGNFKSFDDFLSRVKIDKGTMVALIKSGIFGKNKIDMLKQYCDSLFIERQFNDLKTTSGYTLERLKSELGIDTKDKEERLRLFNVFKRKEHESKEIERRKSHRKDFSDKYMRLRDKWEFETLSIYLTSNPLEDGLKIIKPFETYENGDQVTVIGTVVDITKKRGKNGAFAFIEFYNGERNIELVFWNFAWSKYETKIVKGMDLTIIGTKEEDKVIVSQAKPYEVWCREKKI